MRKAEKIDWFNKGFKILENEGFAKITIDKLCEQMQITKGSFYHHFTNMDGYIDALMAYWLEENTMSIIRNVEASTKNNSKKNVLNDLALKRSLKLEQNIRAWGYSNDRVKKQVQEVDSIRLKYLIGMEIQDGRKPAQARDVAMLTYATLIGLQQLFPDMPKKKQRHLEKFYSAKF